jgi:hypothetical protein
MVVSMRSNGNCGCCNVYFWLNSHHCISFNVWHAWASTPLSHKTWQKLVTLISKLPFFFHVHILTHCHHYTHITNELMNGCFLFLVVSPIVVIVFQIILVLMMLLASWNLFFGGPSKRFFWQWANQNGLLKINKTREATPHWINRTMNQYPTYLWNICMIITWKLCL